RRLALGRSCGRGVGRLRGLLGSLGRLLGLDLLPLLHVLLEDRLAVLGRLRPDALPVLDPRRPELHPVVLVGDVRVVAAQLLDHPPIPRLAGVDGDDPVIVPVRPAHLLHSNANSHGGDPRRTMRSQGNRHSIGATGIDYGTWAEKVASRIRRWIPQITTRGPRGPRGPHTPTGPLRHFRHDRRTR